MQSTPKPPATKKLKEQEIQEKLVEIISLQSEGSEENPLVKKNKVKFISEKTLAELKGTQKKLQDEMSSIQEARRKEQEKKETSKYFKPILKPFNAFVETNKAGGVILNSLTFLGVFAINIATEIVKPITTCISGASAIWGFIRATLDTSRRGNNVEQGVYGLRVAAFIATTILVGLAVVTPITALLMVITTYVTGLAKDSYLANSAKKDVSNQIEVVEKAKETLVKYQQLQAEAKQKVALEIFQDPENKATQVKLAKEYDSLCQLQGELVREEEERLQKYKDDQLKERTRVGLTLMTIIGISLILIPGTQLAGFIVFGFACTLSALEKTGSNPVSRFFGWIGDKISGKESKPEAHEVSQKQDKENAKEKTVELEVKEEKGHDLGPKKVTAKSIHALLHLSQEEVKNSISEPVEKTSVRSEPLTPVKLHPLQKEPVAVVEEPSSTSSLRR